MAMNIACAYPNCTNPVIGQCVGYKEQCGRYYCVQHSDGKLCIECATRKTGSEKAQIARQENTDIVRKVQADALRATLDRRLLVASSLFVLMFVAGFILAEGFKMQALGGVLLLGGVVGLMVCYIVWVILRHNYVNRNLNDLEKTRTGLVDFFHNEETEKQKQVATGCLSIIGIALLGVVASAATQSREEQDEERIRRALDDELKRHNL